VEGVEIDVAEPADVERAKARGRGHVVHLLILCLRGSRASGGLDLLRSDALSRQHEQQRRTCKPEPQSMGLMRHSRLT
jgi:hypothetical protein